MAPRGSALSMAGDKAASRLGKSIFTWTVAPPEYRYVTPFHPHWLPALSPWVFPPGLGAGGLAHPRPAAGPAGLPGTGAAPPCLRWPSASRPATRSGSWARPWTAGWPRTARGCASWWWTTAPPTAPRTSWRSGPSASRPAAGAAQRPPAAGLAGKEPCPGPGQPAARGLGGGMAAVRRRRRPGRAGPAAPGLRLPGAASGGPLHPAPCLGHGDLGRTPVPAHGEPVSSSGWCRRCGSPIRAAGAAAGWAASSWCGARPTTRWAATRGAPMAAVDDMLLAHRVKAAGFAQPGGPGRAAAAPADVPRGPRDPPGSAQEPAGPALPVPPGAPAGGPVLLATLGLRPGGPGGAPRAGACCSGCWCRPSWPRCTSALPAGPPTWPGPSGPSAACWWRPGICLAFGDRLRGVNRWRGRARQASNSLRVSSSLRSTARILNGSTGT